MAPKSGAHQSQRRKALRTVKALSKTAQQASGVFYPVHHGAELSGGKGKKLPIRGRGEILRIILNKTKHKKSPKKTQNKLALNPCQPLE